MTLSQNELMIVGKYFENIYDYINLTKCCTTYQQILKLYKTNFIPISTKSEFELFENLETYNIYTNKDFKTDLKTVSYISTPLSEVEQNKNNNIIYKNAILDYKLSLENLISNTNICSIVDKCFKDYETLQSIVLPYSITKLGNNCFTGCKNLTSVDLSLCVELKELPDYCFAECFKLLNIILPYSITKLCESCFEGCINLINVNLHKNIIELGDYCFRYCPNLRNINLDVCENLTELPKLCFAECYELKNIILPNNVTKLGSNCFNSCTNLSNINLDNIIKLSNHCFAGCKNLTNLNIENCLKFGKYCFVYCENLQDLEILNKATIGSKVF